MDPDSGTAGSGAFGRRVARSAHNEGDGVSMATERGEAFLEGVRWHALWVRSNSEQLVFDQLEAKGLHPFLPKITSWSHRGGRARRTDTPMFAGYLFVHDVVDKATYVEILKARGVVSVLGERWDRLAAVPEAEIDAIRRLQESALPAVHYPYLAAGRRVRVVDGPLAGVEGLLARVDASRDLLVVSIGLFQRSVAVELGCAQVAAA
jgi:transcription termination/antitermination protein NusG